MFIREISDIVQFKSDNYATQYKSKYLFSFWSSLKKKCQEKWLYYYSVSGHNKGLADTMSVSEVKNPIQRVVLD